jgi:saccharopine dehydrogenase (NAD+, L-lysine forming)
MTDEKILIVGGYGEVGRRLATQLEATRPGRVIVAGRHPEQASGFPARRIDVDDAGSIEQALDGVGVVVACIRQREPHVLRAAVRRGIAYTSIAPPRLPWSALEPLRTEAQRTGARIIVGAGLSPGITSVLVRDAADRLADHREAVPRATSARGLGRIDTVQTAVMLSLGDAYGPDSMGFILEEVSHPYVVVVDGREQTWNAFERSKPVEFPAPVGERRAYTMPFTDQFYYPATVGAKTAIARIALDPPWLADALSVLLRVGLRRALTLRYEDRVRYV